MIALDKESKWTSKSCRWRKKLNAGFRVLDDISDMNSSYIHVDWSDIKAAMGGNDLAWSGAGQAEGTDGIVEAAKRAMASFSK